jgi:wobble nucleotide-excising tRNase
MIHKLIEIKSLGRYKKFVTSSDCQWNGIFKKTTIIYADNGTGKTTFTQIFKSLKGDNELLLKRKSFESKDSICISLLDENKKQINFKGNKWNKKIDTIEIFDTFYVESNIYIISLEDYDNKKGTLFEIIIGGEPIQLLEEISNLKASRKKLAMQRKYIKWKIKSLQDDNLIQKSEKDWTEKLKQGESITKEISLKEKQLDALAESFGEKYLQKINEYLKYFNPNIQLTKLNKRGRQFVYYLKVMNYDVRSDSGSISLKHILSEGDKNSLALSFFMARLSLKSDLDKTIIIFDDPISSFDNSRRHVTINLLNNISRKANQFILLSHDLNFAKDFSEKSENPLNLKIKSNGTSSIIDIHDIKKETLSGIFKDLTVLDEYVKNGEKSEFDKRETVRCIRPILEGIFRIKFFNKFEEDEWLGDMIKIIRDSEKGSTFFHLKSILDELTDINDYSKSYHHSNPNYLEVPVNAEELRIYSLRVFELLRKI